MSGSASFSQGSGMCCAGGRGRGPRPGVRLFLCWTHGPLFMSEPPAPHGNRCSTFPACPAWWASDLVGPGLTNRHAGHSCQLNLAVRDMRYTLCGAGYQDTAYHPPAQRTYGAALSDSDDDD